jgi:hypothetical protein
MVISRDVLRFREEANERLPMKLCRLGRNIVQSRYAATASFAVTIHIASPKSIGFDIVVLVEVIY